MEIIQFVDGIAVGRRSSYELINSGLTLEKKNVRWTWIRRQEKDLCQLLVSGSHSK